MGADREEWISKRAYKLWEEAGRPDGQDAEQWAQASAEWDAGQGQNNTDSTAASWDDEEY